MTNPLITVSLIELGVGGLCFAIAAIAVRHRPRPAAIPLALLSSAAGGWAVAAALASLLADPGMVRAAQFAAYAFAGPTAVGWFYVAVGYAGTDRWQRPAAIAGVVGLVLVEWAIIATNPIHQLYVTAAIPGPTGAIDPIPGPALWAGAIWKAGLLAVGIFTLARRYAGLRGVLKGQPVAIIAAGLVAFAAAIIEVTDAIRIPGLDLGVIGIALGAAIILWSLYFAGFLDVVPIARETLLESMHDAVVALDRNGHVVDLNPEAKALFDVDNGAIGTPAAEVFGGYPPLADGQFRRSNPDSPIEITATVDGTVRHFELDVSPVKPAGTVPHEGEPPVGRLGTLLVFRDVTARIERERDVERKNERLEEFASVLTHDLRNPLNVAQGRLNLARETRDSEDLQAVASAHDRMAELIEDLLLFAREGDSIIDPEPVSLPTIVQSCWTNVPTERATLVTTSEATIIADRSRLRELFENVFRNAIEHGGDGVTVTVGDLQDGNGFFVADDGPGVPEPERERVFAREFTTTDGGTGLGLAIVDRITEAHGWTVNITASEPGGARFEFAGVRSVDDSLAV